jgi:hypothetical protein
VRHLAACSVLFCLAAVPAAALPRSVGLTVTLTDARVTLSRASVPTGPVAVTVVNRGTGSRRFAVAGSQTAPIAPGRKTTLKLVLTKVGGYTFVATGKPRTLKGTLHAVTAVAAGGTTTTAAPTPQSSALTSCSRPVSTTVSVTLDDGKFTFSPGVAPCGTVTFSLTNVGKYNHSLNLESSGVQSGALAPGQSERLTVPLGPGAVTWVDGVYETDLGGDSGTYAISG